MKNPRFSDKQFLDATSFNNAAALASGNAELYAQLSLPGLVNAEVGAITATGLVAGAALPSPFAILFDTGLMVGAHGTLSGSDTSNYTADFTSLVPGSGSVTAYLVASYFGQIQQDPIQIIGPPAGHPDYNPTFVPYTAYQTNVDTLQVAATTTPADNVATFELARTPLAAGASGLSLTTAYQVRASANNFAGVLQVSGAISLTASYAGRMLQAVASGAFTFPPASGSAGLEFLFSSATSGAVTILGNGADLLYGVATPPSSGVPSVTLSNGSTLGFVCASGFWQATYGTGITAAQLQQQSGNYAVDTGTANALVITLSPVPTTLVSLIGAPIRITKSAAKNTGACTLAVNGFGAIAIKYASGAALLDNDLPANGEFQVIYDGTQFVLLGITGLSQITNLLGTALNSANGYFHIGSLLIQWGTTAAFSANDGTQTISFPVAFTTACYGVVATTINPTGSATLDHDSFAQVVSTAALTGFDMIQQATSGASGSLDFASFWIAIGH